MKPIDQTLKVATLVCPNVFLIDMAGNIYTAGPALTKKAMEGLQEVINISLETARTAYHKNRTGADV